MAVMHEDCPDFGELSHGCWLLIVGNTTLDELMTHLIRSVDLFSQQQISEIAEEVSESTLSSHQWYYLLNPDYHQL